MFSFRKKKLNIPELSFFSQIHRFPFWMDFAFPLMPIISSCQNSSCTQAALHIQVDFVRHYSTQESNHWMSIGFQDGQDGMRKDVHMLGVVFYKGNMLVNMMKRKTLPHPCVGSPMKTFQYNTIRAKQQKLSGFSHVDPTQDNWSD